LQKFSKAAQVAWKVQGSIIFYPGTQSEKKIKFLLKGYMFTPCVKILWTSNQNWLHRNLTEFSMAHSMENCPLGVKWCKVGTAKCTTDLKPPSLLCVHLQNQFSTYSGSHKYSDTSKIAISNWKISFFQWSLKTLKFKYYTCFKWFFKNLKTNFDFFII